MNISIRPAKEEDLIPIYNLSNDNLVRKNSFKTEKIKLTDHKKWFIKKLKDKNALILVANHKIDFIGQIRFDMGKENVIGVSITPEFRGKGLSSHLITKAIKYLKKSKPKFKNITAYIKINNTASIKAFEKAGFQLDKKLIVNKCPSLRYTYND